jgi:tetratricopeptide (TPR) repeat protein
MSSLGSLPKDTMFHLSLGRTFAKIRTQQHRLAAVDEFEHAVQVSDDSTSTWDVYYSKAKVLCAIGKFEESITAASLALEHLPAYRSYMKRHILQIISSASLSLEKDDEAIQAAVRARDSAPDDPGVAFTLVFTAHRTANYSKTTALMQAALDSPEGAQFLGRVINIAYPQRYTTEYMSIACAKLGDLGLAKKAFEAVKIEATNVGNESAIAAADLAIANLYFGFYRRDTKAIGLWEKVVEEHSHTEPVVTASFALMPVYYWKARSAEPKEKAELVSKMESLVDLIEPIRLNSDSFPTRYEARALLGRWYVENGQTELARANIRPFVMDGIGGLTDRDDDNDYEAFSNLARALTCFGDKKNASIAFAFTKPLNSTHLGSQIDDDQDNTAAPTTVAKGSIGVPSQFSGRCDGACTRREDTFKSFKHCEICIDVAFCEECYQKLLDDTATFRICNPEHPMCEVYPPKGLVTRGSNGYDIHVDDDKVISFDEWLASIAKEWK